MTLMKTNLHIRTPLIESLPLSRLLNCRVWLKIEAVQPSGSFKTRGIGYACQEYVNRGAKRLLASSGGNAGLAVAYCGHQLGVDVTVIVPKSTTERAKELITQEAAQVIVYGTSWDEAHAYALGLCTSETAYIHPFDDPLIWTGHATLIDEVYEAGLSPSLVVLSVGGGGLLCGVVEGMRRNNMGNVPILAAETRGAESLFLSVQRGRLSELDTITSIATTLGAKRVAQRAFEYTKEHEICPVVVEDPNAVEACLELARDHRLIVEPACGAALAPLYGKYPETTSRKDLDDVLVIVCGGAGITIENLLHWNEHLK